jgi:hypothetical protein
MSAPRRQLPHKSADLPDRIQHIAYGLSRLSASGTPEIAALSEVGSLPILQKIAASLPGGHKSWKPLFPAGPSGEISCAVICNASYGLVEIHLDHTGLQKFPNAPSQRRQYANCFEMTIPNAKSRLYVIVCHWPSDYRGNFQPLERETVADWLGGEIRRLNLNSLPLIVAGDFNAEPFDRCFSKPALSAKRRSGHAWRATDSLGLYNPTWQLLLDDYHLEQRLAGGAFDHKDNRPRGSIDLGAAKKLFDAILVNRALFSGRAFKALEQSIRYGTGGSVSRTSKTGIVGPSRWSGKTSTGCSDHLPVLIDLEVV